ncbi:MAG: cytochrome superfamily protein [Actinomycetia bacterium]|nr:cytochrome superfamily protein [Actinomycetes bacterium]
MIEAGSVDFVDDLANIAPAVLTLAKMGLPLADWQAYCEPTHCGARVQGSCLCADRPRHLFLARSGASLAARFDKHAERLSEELASLREPNLADGIDVAR